MAERLKAQSFGQHARLLAHVAAEAYLQVKRSGRSQSVYAGCPRSGDLAFW